MWYYCFKKIGQEKFAIRRLHMEAGILLTQLQILSSFEENSSIYQALKKIQVQMH